LVALAVCAGAPPRGGFQARIFRFSGFLCVLTSRPVLSVEVPPLSSRCWRRCFFGVDGVFEVFAQSEQFAVEYTAFLRCTMERKPK